ncbi:MAG: glycine--tRNA ligase, partial [Phycisphaerae bacterium]|nr:glycine--tRNA ligase [Phycisphaerae bacterium]
MDKPNDLMDKLVSLCKRRGFIFQSSEIYGGLNGCWDYGPLGVELKRNVKNLWWRDMVTSRDDMVGLDASIIMNPKVWEASGHVGGFADPMIDCKKCKGRFRADQLYYAVREGQSRQGGSASVWFSAIADKVEDASAVMELQLKKKGRQIREWTNDFELVRYDQEQSEQAPCPACDEKGSLTVPRAFNLMFKTHCGAMEDSSSVTYLRPETAQGIFVNFKNVLDTQRLKLPFGIAQIGKAFRNEINPRNYTFRSREFEMMEVEYFCHPSQADQWYQYWRKA